jgi:hypothetical protein
MVANRNSGILHKHLFTPHPALSRARKQLVSAPSNYHLQGASMRRHIVALLFILGCLVAGTAQAEQLRFPKTGTNAFLITLAPGWATHEDQYNGIQVFSADHRTLLYLSMVLDEAYKDKPLMELALAIGKPSNITSFPKQEPIAISGMNGQAFYGKMTNEKGTPLDVKMVIIPLGPSLWATQTILTTQGLTAAQIASLKQATSGISIATK